MSSMTMARSHHHSARARLHGARLDVAASAISPGRTGSRRFRGKRLAVARLKRPHVAIRQPAMRCIYPAVIQDVDHRCIASPRQSLRAARWRIGVAGSRTSDRGERSRGCFARASHTSSRFQFEEVLAKIRPAVAARPLSAVALIVSAQFIGPSSTSLVRRAASACGPCDARIIPQAR